ncbi:conserved Plasmodium protein, unknown function [Plasmodium knowlesi strain H]|uniref:Enkurin domain-containing protein n=3 Tax=Plasmodium knowlesi TaxID=5850 RepID=A0A5K1UX08_PLAKH|nr:enkurin domain-containing protein, putative [Plasmodium knowlesi strain H]OTN65284.1 Uncharacterized protein PKNOH_S110085400 [Plasmodium knowlesi]CAA9989475.1 enkurin domain-containing protein, putative [Plasmodium knowlesi strain H]SBO25133.1 conserved Plasmodium protein, unknown function [Plasmodium knowlesi strain H]SBO27797.1 conserved Plasmodium protein, unknown function [Plasmodium knowlesi strain H]VVS78949.1 enkurin domain-containing protein, putative [Plasmodium knowlesi strain H]|eukprot:XP_002260201.1 hypothetical protein, conserved in Plasmodium species [Plasmodium knowlesi strain H]
MDNYEKLFESMNLEDDNAYEIIKKSDEKKLKKILYKSIHDPNVMPSYSTFNLRGKRYNISNVSGESIKKIEKQKKVKELQISYEKKLLKKGEKNQMIPSLNEIKKVNPTLLTVKKKKKKFKDPLPDRNDVPLMNIKADIDYIYDNAVEVIHSKPMVVKKKQGKMLLSENPLTKEDYGKVSPYLIDIKNEIKEKENLKKQDIIDEEKVAADLEAKKEILLTQLKNKYNEINKEYLKISHVVDINSIRKLKKKENYEKQLNQLEKDIQKLQKQDY